MYTNRLLCLPQDVLLHVMSWVEPFERYREVLGELSATVVHEFHCGHHLVFNAVRNDRHKLVDYSWDQVDSGCRCCDNELWVTTYRIEPGWREPDPFEEPYAVQILK